MGEVFENTAIFAQQRPKLFFAVIWVARPQDVMMGTGHVAYGVDLHKPKIADDLQRICGARLGLCNAIRVKPQSPCLFIRKPKHGQQEWRRLDRRVSPRLCGF